MGMKNSIIHFPRNIERTGINFPLFCEIPLTKKRQKKTVLDGKLRLYN